MLRERVEEALGCHRQLLDELEKKEVDRNLTDGIATQLRYWRTF